MRNTEIIRNAERILFEQMVAITTQDKWSDEDLKLLSLMMIAYKLGVQE